MTAKISIWLDSTSDPTSPPRWIVSIDDIDGVTETLDEASTLDEAIESGRSEAAIRGLPLDIEHQEERS